MFVVFSSPDREWTTLAATGMMARNSDPELSGPSPTSRQTPRIPDVHRPDQSQRGIPKIEAKMHGTHQQTQQDTSTSYGQHPLGRLCRETRVVSCWSTERQSLDRSWHGEL